MYERRYLSPRPPSKISLKHDHNWVEGNDQGSTVEHQPVGKFVQQSLGEALQAGSSKEEEKRVMTNHDRTGKLVEGNAHTVQEVGSLEDRDDANKFNVAMDEENIDFNISGVPNTMEKRSHGINVHNLIQQIENHLNDKHFEMISQSIAHSIPSAKSQKMRLWLLGTQNYAR